MIVPAPQQSNTMQNVLGLMSLQQGAQQMKLHKEALGLEKEKHEFEKEKWPDQASALNAQADHFSALSNKLHHEARLTEQAANMGDYLFEAEKEARREDTVHKTEDSKLKAAQSKSNLEMWNEMSKTPEGRAQQWSHLTAAETLSSAQAATQAANAARQAYEASATQLQTMMMPYNMSQSRVMSEYGNLLAESPEVGPKVSALRAVLEKQMTAQDPKAQQSLHEEEMSIRDRISKKAEELQTKSTALELETRKAISAIDTGISPKDMPDEAKAAFSPYALASASAYYDTHKKYPPDLKEVVIPRGWRPPLWPKQKTTVITLAEAEREAVKNPRIMQAYREGLPIAPGAGEHTITSTPTKPVEAGIDWDDIDREFQPAPEGTVRMIDDKGKAQNVPEVYVERQEGRGWKRRQ